MEQRGEMEPKKDREQLIKMEKITIKQPIFTIVQTESINMDSKFFEGIVLFFIQESEKKKGGRWKKKQKMIDHRMAEKQIGNKKEIRERWRVKQV